MPALRSLKLLPLLTATLLSAALLLPGCGTVSPSHDVYTVRPDGTGDYETIQDAVDAVGDGDIIELADGVFTGEGNRDIHVSGDRDITIRSESGNPLTCVIDVEGAPRAEHFGIRFWQSGYPESVLEGITITNAYHHEPGAAVSVGHGNLATITNCRFLNNTTEGGAAVNSSGGALRARDGSEVNVVRCVFSGNHAQVRGGAASCSGTTTFTDCVFTDNSANDSGGALACWDSATIVGCTIVGNSAPAGGGIYYGLWADPVLIERTIISDSPSGHAVYAFDGVVPDMSCCDLYDNEGGDWTGVIAPLYGIDGNISADPEFCDPDVQDFRLNETSPCSPANSGCGQIGAYPPGCVGWDSAVLLPRNGVTGSR